VSYLDEAQRDELAKMLNDADDANEAGRNRAATMYLHLAREAMEWAQSHQDGPGAPPPPRRRVTKLVPMECPECQGDMVLTGINRLWGLCDDCDADIALGGDVTVKQGRAYMRQAA